MSEKKVSFKVAGIHVSGPSAGKTALCFLGGKEAGPPWTLLGLYPKIAPMGAVFSDERILEILRANQPLVGAFVDCPLTVPPCVACTRPVCPGAWNCDDVAVAYMLAQTEKVRERRPKKRRVVNPQAQRLWDVLHVVDQVSSEQEPSYSSNLAPLVVRAQTLQRRLRSLDSPLTLRETSVPHAVKSLAAILGLRTSLPRDYRNFEVGRKTREKVLDILVRRRILAPVETWEFEQDIVASVDVFASLVTALVAAAWHAGLVEEPPAHFMPTEGWVYLPGPTRGWHQSQSP